MSDSESSFISSSSYESTDDNDSSVETDDGITGMYENEPQYNEEEVKKHQSVTSELDDTTSDEADSSRLENLHWCSCGICVIGFTMRIEEAKCCRECNVLGEKIQDIKCITTHGDFDTLILNKSVLELSFIRQRRYQNKYSVLKMNNKYVLV